MNSLLVFFFLGAIAVAYGTHIDLPYDNTFHQWLQRWNNDNTCEPFYDYLEDFDNDVPDEGRCFPADKDISSEINDWFTADLGNTEASCRNALHDEELCEAFHDLATQCSCDNLKCFGREMQDRLADLGNDNSRDDCKALIEDACSTYNTYINIVCPEFERLVKNAATSAGGQPPTAKVFECADICVGGRTSAARRRSTLSVFGVLAVLAMFALVVLH